MAAQALLLRDHLLASRFAGGPLTCISTCPNLCTAGAHSLAKSAVNAWILSRNSGAHSQIRWEPGRRGGIYVRTFVLAAAAGSLVASPAAAGHYRSYSHHHRHHNNDRVLTGVLAGAVIGGLLASSHGYGYGYASPYYGYSSYPAYGYGYPSYGNAYPSYGYYGASYGYRYPVYRSRTVYAYPRYAYGGRYYEGRRHHHHRHH